MEDSADHDVAEDRDADRAAQAAFHLALRARGVRDLAVLRAMERVPRHLFVPERHVALAARDLAVPLACGQTLTPAWLVARMVEALAVAAHHRVLEIGSGSGFATAMLAQLATAVVGVERVRVLALAAEARLAALGHGNAAVRWGDGTAGDAGLGAGEAPFDRMVVHARVPDLSVLPLARLAEGGVLVCVRPGWGGITRLRGGAAGWEEAAICPCDMPVLRSGLNGSG